MRPSPLRHPVAVLRKIIGLGQKELANLCGCSPRTIQAVELKQLALSEDLATRIEATTGANVAWLLAGDPSAPPLDSLNMGYEKAAFEEIQGAKGIAGFVLPEYAGSAPTFEDSNLQLNQTLLAIYAEGMADWLHAQIYDIFVNCIRKNGNISIPAYRLQKVVGEVLQEFGRDASASARSPAVDDRLTRRFKEFSQRVAEIKTRREKQIASTTEEAVRLREEGLERERAKQAASGNRGKALPRLVAEGSGHRSLPAQEKKRNRSANPGKTKPAK